MRGDAFGSGRPVGRQRDQFRAEQRENPRRLGKRGVVADVEPDSNSPRVMHSERTVAKLDVLVDAEERQVYFAVRADDSVRPRENRRVENGIAVNFDHAEHGENVELGTQRRDAIGRRARNLLSERSRLGEILKAVTGHGTLRKDRQSGSVGGSLAEAFFDRREVEINLAEFHVHLHTGNFHRFVFSFSGEPDLLERTPTSVMIKR